MDIHFHASLWKPYEYSWEQLLDGSMNNKQLADVWGDLSGSVVWCQSKPIISQNIYFIFHETMKLKSIMDSKINRLKKYIKLGANDQKQTNAVMLHIAFYCSQTQTSFIQVWENTPRAVLFT